LPFRQYLDGVGNLVFPFHYRNSHFFTHKSIEEEKAGLATIHAILPDGHDTEKPLLAAIWLHGYGWNLSHVIADQKIFQQIANDLGIAVAGISATGKMEENTWEWAEGAEMDRDYIRAVLSANTDQLKLKSSRHILFGFSQGAKVAGDLAMNYPETYCGAIVMSPGGKKTIRTTRLHHRLDTFGRFTIASSARTNPMETFL
jgi:predicted esterase